MAHHLFAPMGRTVTLIGRARNNGHIMQEGRRLDGTGSVVLSPDELPLAALLLHGGWPELGAEARNAGLDM